MDAVNSAVDCVKNLTVAVVESDDNNGHEPQQRRKKQESLKAADAAKPHKSLEARTKL